jgi:hypothetical protein
MYYCKFQLRANVNILLSELSNIYAVVIVVLCSVEMINKLFYSILFYIRVGGKKTTHVVLKYLSRSHEELGKQRFLKVRKSLIRNFTDFLGSLRYRKFSVSYKVVGQSPNPQISTKYMLYL